MDMKQAAGLLLTKRGVQEDVGKKIGKDRVSYLASFIFHKSFIMDVWISFIATRFFAPLMDAGRDGVAASSAARRRGRPFGVAVPVSLVKKLSTTSRSLSASAWIWLFVL